MKNEQQNKSGSEDRDALPERQVTEEDMMEFTKRTGLTIFEASAKSGHGVESSFIALAEALIEKAAQSRQNQEN